MMKMSRQGVCCIGFTSKLSITILTKRRDLGIWYTPGGGIEDGEGPEEAAKREFKEETGLDILIKTYHGRYDLMSRLFPFYIDRTHLYSGIIIGGELKLNDEVSELEYFEVSNMPKGLPFYCRRWVSDAQQGIIYKPNVEIRAGLLDLLGLLYRNPQLIYPGLPRLIKNLTRSSGKPSGEGN